MSGKWRLVGDDDASDASSDAVRLVRRRHDVRAIIETLLNGLSDDSGYLLLLDVRIHDLPIRYEVRLDFVEPTIAACAKLINTGWQRDPVRGS